MIKIVDIYLYKNNKLANKYGKVRCLQKKDTISFKIDEAKMTISPNFLIRENEDFEFKLDIINKKSTYLLKSQNILYDIMVNEAKYLKESKGIIINYNIETDDSTNKIIIKESDE